MGLEARNIAIIGAGIIGLSCAVRLTNAGHKVTLIDRDEPGKGTSFGNAGHIATEQIHPLASPQTIAALPKYLLDPSSPIKLPLSYLAQITPWLFRFAYASRPSQFKRGTAALTSLQLTALSDLQELLAIAGTPNLLYQSGNLVVLEKSHNIVAAQQQIRTYKQAGIAVDWVSATTVQEKAPSLNGDVVGAMHFSETGHVANPYSVSKALEGYLRKNGASVLKEEALSIEHTDCGIKLTTTNQTIEADLSILSAGAFSKRLASQNGVSAPLETERGYHIHMSDVEAGFSVPIASYERKVIMTPMNDGLRATGIVEFGGLKIPPCAKNYETIRQHVEKLVPGIKTKNASAWMGYRPSLPDHLPAIGYTDTSQRILCAFGHQHLGLTLAGVTAKLVSELVANKEPNIDMSPFNPNRFS